MYPAAEIEFAESSFQARAGTIEERKRDGNSKISSYSDMLICIGSPPNWLVKNALFP
jgi:hypothetical protein